jgi:hypothetical protein
MKRNVDVNRSGAARFRLDHERSVQHRDPFLHPHQAEPPFASRSVHGGINIEAAAIVFNDQAKGSLSTLENDAHLGCFCMLGNVGQRFLGDAKDRDFDVRGCDLQSNRSEGAIASLHARAPRPIGQVNAKRNIKTEVVESRRPELDSQAVDGVTDLARSPPDLVELLACGVVRGEGIAEQLEVKDQRGDVLAHLVVQLARNASTLLFLGGDDLVYKVAPRGLGPV